MHSKFLKPLAMTFSLGLLPACPGNPGTTTEGSSGTETDADDSTTDENTTPPDPTVPTTTGDTTTDDTTTNPTDGTTTDDTTTDDTTTDSTTGGLAGLCDRLGGPAEGGIQDLVGGFLGVVLADDKINGYFLNSDVDAGNLLSKVTAQLGEVAQCEGVTYDGLGMKEAHQGLGISTQDFMDFAADFTTALDTHAADHPDLTDADKTAILEVLGTLLPDIVEDVDNNQTVYQRVGRKPAIKSVIGAPDSPDSFIALVLADPAINTFFNMADPVRLNTCLTRQVSSIDGPVEYGFEVDSPAAGVDEGVGVGNECRDMVSSHENLQDAEMTFITVDDFFALVTDLMTAMTTAGVAADDQTAILSALGPLCDQIVVGNGEKNKCPGNFKAELVELPGLAQPLMDDAYNGTLETMVCNDFVVEEDADEIGFVNDIEIKLGLDHTWAGDVTVKVQGPSGAILTVVNRPGKSALPDNGTGCCNDDSDLSKDFPITFKNGGATDAAMMGTTISALKVICKDDTLCEFAPNPGMGPGVDFSDFLGETGAGTWKVCVGDSNFKDLGTLDYLGLTLNKVRYDPKL